MPVCYTKYPPRDARTTTGENSNSMLGEGDDESETNPLNNSPPHSEAQDDVDKEVSNYQGGIHKKYHLGLLNSLFN